MDITPITVEQLNTYIKNKIDGDEFLNNVYVKGEISNFKLHYTGHMYFTLKDEHSLIKCIMFKSYTPHLSFMPKDGMKVMILGSVSVFERDGVYQIYAKAMKQDGIGSLYEAFEKMKAKLETEGLFDSSHKKEIPKFPKTIGVGPTAASQIVDGIRRMNDEKMADVIILGRGGGSLEDLWPFNEEIVARAIYDSEIPIISAVGHETDYSISDFVADLRAPTPSAAAELAVPNISDVKYTIVSYENRYKIALKKKTELMKMRYEKCMTQRVFKEPLQKINEKAIVIDFNVKSITKCIKNKINISKSEFTKLVSKIDALSPMKTLSRGYSITQKDGKIIKKANELKRNDQIEIRYSDGTVDAKII